MSKSDLGPPDCRSRESPTLKPGKSESSPGGLRGLGPCGFGVRKDGHHSPKSFSRLVLTSSKHLQIKWFLSRYPQRQHHVMQLQSEPVQGLTQARGWSVRQGSFALGGRKGKKSEGVPGWPQKPRVLVPVESQACVWPWAGPNLSLLPWPGRERVLRILPTGTSWPSILPMRLISQLPFWMSEGSVSLDPQVYELRGPSVLSQSSDRAGLNHIAGQ